MHPDITRSRPRVPLPTALRIVACLVGLSVTIAGVLLAAEAGEILVGAPIIFLGGYCIAVGVTGTVPRRFRR